MPDPPENFLILVADDMGVDMVGAYGVGTDLPPTPNLDALATQGVRFTNAWSNPVCSPTRAALQTGRYSFRTGVGQGVDCSLSPLTPASDGLPSAEITLPEMLKLRTGQPYTAAAFGKWHLSTAHQGGLLAPNVQGYDHYEGPFCGSLADYFNWTKVTNGTTSVVTQYATSHHVDNALAWISQTTGPWICYVAFNNPHSPYHAPPSNLHTIDLSGAGPPELDPRPYFKAQVEAMDTEIGRLLAGLGSQLDETMVVFVSDNGTPDEVIQPPFAPGRGKRSLYQGGVNVPFIVSGPTNKTPGTCDALVGVTDLFATLAEIAGVDLHDVHSPGRQFDSVSLIPYLVNPSTPSIRQSVVAEWFGPNGPKEGLMTSPANTYLCQADLGYQGPGAALLAVCGQPLYLNNTASMTLTNGPASSMATLYRSPLLDPRPLYGGIIAPAAGIDPEIVFTDPLGQFEIPTLDLQDYYTLRAYYPESQTIYVQMAIYDPPQTGGYSISNAVGMVMPGWNMKAIRNSRYKLIIDFAGDLREFYDLTADPYELNELIAGGLNPAQQAAYDQLEAELRILMASE
ncbi:MAG: sulfatase-like hydrolase/transferase [Planctomycetota bacterium]